MTPSAARWDLFCRVVDNFGDIGVCWRLARQLVQEHELQVRLWVDDLVSFARLEPHLSLTAGRQTLQGVEVWQWNEDFPQSVEVAEVVIEAFACTIPPAYVASMAAKAKPPVWINLEYLSAEDWVEECHGLPSPQTGLRLAKSFFFPGFTARTGGVLRERTLLVERAEFDDCQESRFLQSLGIPPRNGEELRVCLFCYNTPALPRLLEVWRSGTRPVRLFCTPGAATEQVLAWSRQDFPKGQTWSTGNLTVHLLPWIAPCQFDRLLWSCDLNFVRGEDSFVRAQWAQRPFVWQIYPQQEGAHWEKFEAFLNKFLSDSAEFQPVRAFWRAWNGRGDPAEDWLNFLNLFDCLTWHGKLWARELDRMGNLADNLARFVREDQS